MYRFRLIILLLSALICLFVVSSSVQGIQSAPQQLIYRYTWDKNIPSCLIDADLLLILEPSPPNVTGEYTVVQGGNFSVECIAMSSDPDVFVFWRRTDGMPWRNVFVLPTWMMIKSINFVHLALSLYRWYILTPHQWKWHYKCNKSRLSF